MLDIPRERHTEGNGETTTLISGTWSPSAASASPAPTPTDGHWIRFLKRHRTDIGGADIYLWHQLATDFNEMRGDRLKAAYWITSQDECDRATAWHFIAGLVSWDILESELIHADQPAFDSTVAAFFGLLHRWNKGFFRYHALSPVHSGGNGFHGFHSTALYSRLKRIEDRFSIVLPRMHAFDMDLSRPLHSSGHAVRGPFAFRQAYGLYRHAAPARHLTACA